MDKELCRGEAQDRKFYVYTHVSHCTYAKNTNNQCSVPTSAYVKQGGGGQSGQRALWRGGGLTLESICPGNVGIYAVAAHFRPRGHC